MQRQSSNPPSHAFRHFITNTMNKEIINKYNDDSQILRFKLYYYNVKLNEQYNLGLKDEKLLNEVKEELKL